MLDTITQWNVREEHGMVRVEWGSETGKRYMMRLTELEAMRLAHSLAQSANETRAHDPRAQVT